MCVNLTWWYLNRMWIVFRLLRSWILKPLISRDTITARHKAIDWFLKHQADVELMSLKKSLKLLPNLDKRLTAILHGRCRPREFHGLCCSWLQFRQSVIQFKSFYEDLPSSISSSLDSAIDSLTCVPSYLQQINESAVKSGDKTQIFADLTNYPNLLQMVDQIQHIENQLQVHIFFYWSLYIYAVRILCGYALVILIFLPLKKKILL